MTDTPTDVTRLAHDTPTTLTHARPGCCCCCSTLADRPGTTRSIRSAASINPPIHTLLFSLCSSIPYPISFDLVLCSQLYRISINRCVASVSHDKTTLLYHQPITWAVSQFTVVVNTITLCDYVMCSVRVGCSHFSPSISSLSFINQRN